MQLRLTSRGRRSIFYSFYCTAVCSHLVQFMVNQNRELCTYSFSFMNDKIKQKPTRSLLIKCLKNSFVLMVMVDKVKVFYRLISTDGENHSMYFIKPLSDALRFLHSVILSFKFYFNNLSLNIICTRNFFIYIL